MKQTQALFETGAATHVGKVRGRNEDSYLTRPETGIWAVADGMGGHDDGQLASQTVIEALRTIETPASASDLLTLCETKILGANSTLHEISLRRDAVIGTTVVALLVADGYFASVWCGDSRLYIIRNGEITQVTRDHSELQELLASGAITPEQAVTWTGRNAITRAVGVVHTPELEITSAPLDPGDVFVICSDGLTRHVADQEIALCIDGNNSQQACDRLIAMTLERGATDNVTVIVVRYDSCEGANFEGAARAADLSEPLQ